MSVFFLRRCLLYLRPTKIWHNFGRWKLSQLQAKTNRTSPETTTRARLDRTRSQHPLDLCDLFLSPSSFKSFLSFLPTFAIVCTDTCLCLRFPILSFVLRFSGVFYVCRLSLSLLFSFLFSRFNCLSFCISSVSNVILTFPF